MVSVVGEPGVGKSRLFYELVHSHRTQGWLVLEAASVSYGKATSYLPVVELMKSYFRIQDSDTQRDIREKITGKLLTLDETLRPTLPALASLLDLPIENVEWQDMAPQTRRERILDSLKRLLLREAQVQPLLLVFEDLHWTDSETQALLDSLVESLPATKLLLLTNYRPEYQQRWGSRTYYTQVSLDVLPPQSAFELLESLLGHDPALGPLKRLLVTSTDGNPFFLEECVRTLVETGALAGERGATRLTQPVSALRLPATVQAVLAARIDRLQPEEKHLLQVSAAIGKDVPYGLLREVAECTEDQLAQRLHQLQSGEYLYETQLFPDLEYTFKHALTHEIAYGAVLQDTRRALHTRIMQAIERIYTQRLDEQVERLAHHALRGEQWDKALSYLRQTGDKAFGRSAIREGAAAYEQALSALTHLPETRETMEQTIDLAVLVRAPLTGLAQPLRFLKYAREADTLAAKLHDPLRHGWALAILCQAHGHLGDLTEAVDCGQRALAIAADLGDANLAAGTNYFLGSTYAYRGSYRKAIEFLLRHTLVPNVSMSDLHSRERGRAMLGFLLSGTGLYTWAQGVAAWCFSELGVFNEAIAHAEKAQQVAAVWHEPWTQGGADAYLGLVQLRRGELDRAIALLEGALNTSRTADAPVLLIQLAARLGSAYNLAGRIPESIALLEEARAMADSVSYMAWAPLIHAHLGEAYALNARIEEGLDAVRNAVDLARQHEERGYEAWALYLMGRVHTLGNAPDKASARPLYTEALALAHELGMRPLEAQCHLSVGTLGDQTDRNQDACERVRTAASMFREMGMQSWLKKAEAALDQR